MTVQCLLREELPAAAPTPLRAASAPPTNGASPDDTAVPATHEPAVESAADLADAVQPGDDATFDEEGFAQRVKAAQNLFDAELVEPPER
jgi:hypothetical protein